MTASGGGDEDGGDGDGADLVGGVGVQALDARKYMYLVHNKSLASSKGKGAMYLRLLLGYDEDGKPVLEYLHRLLLWLYVGPPARPEHDVCMHLCDIGVCACVRHMYWGTRAANYRSATDEYLDMIRTQWFARYDREGCPNLPGSGLKSAGAVATGAAGRQ